MKEGKVIKTEEDADDAFWKLPYIAFLDVLGFTSLVKNNPHNVLVDIYGKLINSPVNFYSKYYEKTQKDRKEKLKDYFRPTNIRFANISDSILIWTNDSREDSLVDLIKAVQMLMSIAMSLGIPLRGSISKGEIEVLENKNVLSIIGKGLVYAYEAENKQEWSGCLLSSEIIKYLRSFQNIVMQIDGPSKIEKLKSLVVETEIPIKNGSICGFAVNWTDMINLTEEQIVDSFSKHNKRVNETEKQTEAIEEKIKNTLIFYRTFKTQNLSPVLPVT